MSERIAYKSLDVTVHEPFKMETKADLRREDHPEHKVHKSERFRKEN